MSAPKMASVPIPVSVVVTAFNRADVVPRAIKSVLDQSFPDFELIVVDDASEDNTADVVAAFSDSRIRLIRSPVNRGIAGAKNLGLEAARGEFVAFLDSDDEWFPRKLERQLAELRRTPLPLSFTAFCLSRGNDTEIVRRPRRRNSWLEATVSGVYTCFGSTLLATRACFEKVGLLSEDLPRIEDVDWLLRYFERYDDFLCIDEPLARINHSGWPDPAKVEDSARRLVEVHGWRLAGRDTRLEQLLRASLQFEIAVAHWRNGSPTRSLRHLATAILTRPAFATEMARRAASKVAQRDFA